MDETYDVIVVGFGFAGGIAAIEAHDAGARVLLVEKAEDAGGISVCSAGGLRITNDAGAAFEYLTATNAGTAPDAVLRVLADGMRDLPDYVKGLTDAVDATLGLRDSPANYPFPGYESFGFAYVDALPGFDPAVEFGSVRGSPAGARLFKVVLDNVRKRPGIDVRVACAAEKLVRKNDIVCGVIAGGRRLEARRGVVLACGGFEGDAELQRNWWSIKPVLSAAVRANTGDGIRMAQEVGAGLWHMWHFHGSYGFRHPDPSYPFGIRVKRLPDWIPGRPFRDDVQMSWVLVDRSGRRFVNEYEPYMQDTGHRALDVFDPATQSHPRIPAIMVLDRKGRERYPLSAPTWHDREVAARFGNIDREGLDDRILSNADTVEELAAAMDANPAGLRETIEGWNRACRAGSDPAFGRPAASMMPIAEPPFFAAMVWPIVSNTHGGPVHDAAQQVLDAFGEPIPGLFSAGELGSVFGHLYMSGGNIAECFVGGRIAGRRAAARASFD
jgi:succinate dehydrogenase/fumarate reductase flavoprotein subunit